MSGSVPWPPKPPNPTEGQGGLWSAALRSSLPRHPGPRLGVRRGGAGARGWAAAGPLSR